MEKRKKIVFLSNHTDTTFLKTQFPGAQILLVKHPHLDPTWSEEELIENCRLVIQLCLEAEELICTGEYFLVSYIVQSRLAAGKRTGFISFRKVNPGEGKRGKDGKVEYRNILEQVGIRWLTMELIHEK